MKRRKRLSGMLLLIAMVMALAVPAVLTAAPVYAAEAETEKETTDSLAGKWIKKDGKYYWKLNSTGKIYKEYGIQELDGKTYFLCSDGHRYAGWKLIDGYRYFFDRTTGIRRETKGFFKDGKYTYYINSRYQAVVGGKKKIDGKYYYFTKSGILKRNHRAIELDGKYYNIDKNGVLESISKKQAQAEKDAIAFIKKHTTSKMTNAQKFRKCFNYMEAYMRYTPGYFKTKKDYAAMKKTDWQYTFACEMFESSNLRGNCHRFACCVAAVAKELGYEPYVIVMTCDHSVVQINGKYYDNMGARFAASHPYHSKFKTYLKVKY